MLTDYSCTFSRGVVIHSPFTFTLMVFYGEVWTNLSILIFLSGHNLSYTSLALRVRNDPLHIYRVGEMKRIAKPSTLFVYGCSTVEETIDKWTLYLCIHVSFCIYSYSYR